MSGYTVVRLCGCTVMRLFGYTVLGVKGVKGVKTCEKVIWEILNRVQDDVDGKPET